jgi:hypothetical protein
MSWAGKVRSAKQVLPAGQQFGRSFLPGRTSRLAATVRRGLQQITLKLAANSDRSGAWRVLPYELGSASPNVHSGRMDVLWQQFGRSCLPGRTSRLAATVRRDSQQETFEVSEAARGRLRVQMRVRVRLCRTSIPAEWTY